jgi:hypothetical protein
MTASVDHSHTAKPDVAADDQALRRVTPVSHAHVNWLGRYDLDRQPPPAGQLRRIDEDTRATPTPPLGVNGDKCQVLDFARMMALPRLVLRAR